MTIEKIRYFIEVARTGNLSQAAKNLYISQPNLSKQIAQMEKECGICLFSRTRHKLELTEAGSELYEHIQKVPQIVDLAFSRARKRSLQGKQHLSIGVMELQEMNEMLMPAIAEFSKKHPETNVNLDRNGFEKLRTGLHNDIFDLIITMQFDAKDSPEFEEMVLSEPFPTIAVHKNAALAKRKSVSFGDLKDEPFVLIASRETPHGERKFLDECERFGFIPNLVRRPTSLESLLLCVEAGIGIALLDNNIRLDPNTPIKLIPVKDIESVCFTAVWKKSSQNSMLKAFLPILKAFS